MSIYTSKWVALHDRQAREDAVSKPIQICQWLDIMGKWLHVRLQPPTYSHVVTINQCDGKPPWEGAIYGAAENVDFASDARVVDVRYDPPKPEDFPLEPEFPNGRFLVTLQLPTMGGLRYDR